MDFGYFKIQINLDDGKRALIPEVNILQSILIENKKKVVIFGDGNLTLSLSLAILREESWAGMTVCFYENSPNIDSELTNTKLIAKDALSHLHSHCHRLTIKQVEISYLSIDRMPPIIPMSGLPIIMYGVDPTKVSSIPLKNKVVWYQCVSSHNDDLYEAICGFINNIRGQQDRGDFLLIGIFKLFPHVKLYKLQEFGLFGRLSCRDVRGYRFLGGDITLVNLLLQYGYCHKETENGLNNNISHNEIINDHVTLVFTKN